MVVLAFTFKTVGKITNLFGIVHAEGRSVNIAGTDFIYPVCFDYFPSFMVNLKLICSMILSLLHLI